MKDMFLTDRKLDRRITEVKKYRYRNIRNLEEFAVQEDLQGVVNPQVPTEFDNWDTIHTGDCWSGRDRYLWMHKDIEIPAQWKGQRVVGQWHQPVRTLKRTGSFLSKKRKIHPWLIFLFFEFEVLYYSHHPCIVTYPLVLKHFCIGGLRLPSIRNFAVGMELIHLPHRL